jgi:heat shock protein HtpX
MTNNIKTLLLLATLTGLIIWIGDMIGGPNGMIMAFGFAILMNGVSYWFSDKIVLMMYGAKPVLESEDPELYSIVRNLAMSAGIPVPRIFKMASEAPNAFATGRNPSKGVIVVTDGLRRLMSKEEVQGVIAHELSHIKNRDILISTIAAVLAGAIMMLARLAQFAAIFGGGRSSDNRRGGGLELLVLVILTPIAAMLIQLAISRSREYQADATGATIAHSSQGLASALAKLGAYSQRIPMNANPSTAHMFIVNPLSGGSIMNLLSTHPPLEKRIERLRSMHI